ncbi:Transcriptional regulator, ArsR family [Devosia sp. LC5]|uniref:ArsR/SmtB family transcription factor n=1 Tax=Devosia sp. LC5 TaxID=1502724 RepID=UPI0004E3C323|nr:metalloregulator ArsR/SmtB family transcription factor [Devosia sp. LC5]KFC71002.1 Transcriptional regulator, ArsR family [Devosia sp. LC5]
MAPVPIFIALADPTRCRIVELLRAGPSPVHRLAAEFDISRPAISRHLRVLREAGLIREEKSGRENHYALQAKRLTPVRKWLDKQAPAPGPAAVAKPAPAPLPDPVADVVTEAPVPAKPRKPAPLSQMGFDF